MMLDSLWTSTAQVAVEIESAGGDATATMILPTGSVVRVDSFDPADRSVGIFSPVIVLEVGTLDRGQFVGSGIFVELVDPDEAFAFVPVAPHVRLVHSA